ncbi:MAG: transcriptional regulator [Myxococcaceae bacterium]|nr:transcriptional regulator [Myxococcaceae bacterium]
MPPKRHSPEQKSPTTSKARPRESLSRSIASPEPTLQSVASPLVASNVSRHRRAQNLSRAALAARAELSELTLTSIEEGTEPPTIRLLWSLANALGITFSELVRGPESAPLDPLIPSIARRSLLPNALLASAQTQLHELKLAPGAAGTGAAGAKDTSETLLVTSGSLVVYYQGQRAQLSVGQSLTLPGDVERRYENPGAELVVAYTKLSPRQLG